MARFDEFWTSLLEGLKGIASQQLDEAKESAIKDGEAFLEATQQDLRRWTELLAQRELTPDDFSSLLLGRVHLAQMHALKQLGLNVVRIDRLRFSLINLVIDTAFDTFLPG